MDLSQFHSRLFKWFRQHGRVLPWREKNKHQKKGLKLRDQSIASYFTKTWQRDPYRVVISELMLQQTQVDRVLPKFEEFIKRWPTTAALAKATLSEVIIAWQGLGYNRRARYLHEMAKTIMEKYEGKFPTNEEDLLQLPGIGQYTARAILAFAHGKDVGVIDTNIQRIFARTILGCEAFEISLKKKEFLELVDASVPKGKGDPWNQALMDFGALVCAAVTPKCDGCPVSQMCMANQDAIKRGSKNYAEYLTTQRKTKTKKPFVTKFKDTDRYFRGRIVDKLREGETHMQNLRDHIEKNHGLTDKVRFGNIIEQLMKDKLIVIRASMVSLD